MILRRAPLTTAFFALLAFASAEIHHFPKTYTLVSVKWSISFDESKRAIEGDVINTVRPLTSATSIPFDCARLDVGKVTVNGVNAKFTQANDVLNVDLPTQASAGETLAIDIAYSGNPTAGVYFIPAKRAYPAHTSMVYTQGEMIDTRYWLPTYDWPDNKATFEAAIEVPAGYYALSNGKLVDVLHKGSKDVYHWKLDEPQSTYLISFVAGRYDEGQDSGADIPTYYYVPEGLKDWGTATFGGTSKIVDFYGKILDFKYPYPKFSQAAVADYMFGGMENTTCVTQTINALFPPKEAPVSDATGLVAHELAHQWFGDTLTCVDWKNAWLNEGFASFMPLFWIRERDGQDAFDLDRLDVFKNGYDAQVSGHRAVVWDKVAEPIDLFDGVLYPGGASRLQMLMFQLGEPAFWKGMHDYLEKYKYQNVDTDLFIDSMSKSSGVDLKKFETQWLLNPEIPSLSASMDGKSLVIKQPVGGFDFPLDVWVWDGTWIKKKIEIDHADNRLQLGDLAGRPLLIDPEVHCMVPVEYRLEYSGADWMTLYRNAPNAAQKAMIIQNSFSGLTSVQKLELAREEKSWRLVRRMIEAMGGLEADYLLEQTRNSDPRIEAAALGTLVQVVQSPKPTANRLLIMARFKELFESDTRDEIRLAGLQGLVAASADEALVQRAWEMESYNEGFRKFALDWWTQHKPDRARETCLDVLNGSYSEPVRRSAIRHLGSLKDKAQDRPVFAALVRAANESSFGAKSDAFAALGNYGDPAAIKTLTPYTNASLHFIRRAAERAIAQLKGKPVPNDGD